MNHETITSQFPILTQKVRGQRLAYLDNAATTQRPQRVLTAIDQFYRTKNANPHRGVHYLADAATEAFEQARQDVAHHIGAKPQELVFTRGTTESLNQFVMSYGQRYLKSGDAVVLTEMEHHANLVPWYLLVEQKGIELRFASLADDGSLDLEDVAQKLEGAAAFACCHVSNVLGCVNPLAKLAQMARDADVHMIVDGAQALGRLDVDVHKFGVDAYAFSGHKAYGPFGIGGLWVRSELLAQLPPVYGGGEMIRSVDFGQATYADPPYRFEAGTMPVAEVVGLQAALSFIESVGMSAIADHEQKLTAQLVALFGEESRVKILGPRGRVGVVSFVVEGIHPHDLATIFDQHGVAIRSGHHCAEPLHRRLGIPASARISLAVYNTEEDIIQAHQALKSALTTFHV